MQIGDLVKLNNKASLGLTRWKFNNHYPNELESEKNIGLIVAHYSKKYRDFDHNDIEYDHYAVQQLSTGIIEDFIKEELILFSKKERKND
jgi:hypothetical protein